ncbi:hypothetical protein V8G54_023946, partial [Vigna mungo]
MFSLMGFLPRRLGLEDDSKSFACGPLSCNNGEREKISGVFNVCLPVQAGRDLRFISLSMVRCFCVGSLVLWVLSSRFGLLGCWFSLAIFQWARFSMALQRLLSPNGVLYSEDTDRYELLKLRAAYFLRAGPATVVCDYLSYVFMFLSIATSNMVATALAKQ